MSLNVALFNALTGLRVNQRAIDFTAQNVANVNTEGYSRKEIQQVSLIYEGVGAGVDIAQVSREVNEFLVRDMRTAQTQLENTAVLDDFYSRMQDLFGTLSSDSSPAALIAELGARMQAWALTPENLSIRTEVVARAEFLTQRINSISGTVQNMRLEADRAISNAVDELNANLQEIATLNTQIARNLELNLPASDLQDQRDIAINAVAQHVNINYFTRDNGEVVIMTENGRPILDRTPVPFAHTAASNFSSSLVYDGGAGAIDGITLGGVDITADIRQGRIGGLIELRDSILPDFGSQFEELAQSVHDTFNAIHNQGTAFPGPETITGTKSVAAGDPPDWTGSFRLAVLDGQGAVVEVQDFDLSTYATMGDLVTAIDGMTNASASINANGNLVIDTATGNHLALNEMTSAVTLGNKSVGFSSFAGLNDLFTGGSSYDSYQSAQQTSRTTALNLSGTLTLSGAFGSEGIAYGTGDTLEDIAAAITANGNLAAAGVSARAIQDGTGFRLSITDADGGNIFLADSGTLTSALNLHARNGGSAPLIAIRSDIAANPTLLAHGTLSDAAGLAVGETGLTVGDASISQLLANKFAEDVSFDAIGTIGTGSRTLSEFAGEIAALNAGQANNVSGTLTAREFLFEDLKTTVTSISGVNLDEEMARMIILENAYAAAARVVTVTSELFDILQDIVR